MADPRNKVITCGGDRVVLRVVKPKTTAEELDELLAERGDCSNEYDPLAPRRLARATRPQHRGRS